LRNLARAHLFATKLDAAVERLEEAERRNPESAVTTYLFGIARARQLRFADATLHIEQ
jgi:ubiquinone/menaquinone biosynthesis C-methylase UbiE